MNSIHSSLINMAVLVEDEGFTGTARQMRANIEQGNILGLMNNAADLSAGGFENLPQTIMQHAVLYAENFPGYEVID